MNMQSKKTTLSRGLPKTGQQVSYYAGDDGIYEAGWWKGKLITDNLPRFISKSVYGQVTVLDRATGLVWAADGHDAGCGSGIEVDWETALGYANLLDFGGYDDWRIPNIRELQSIADYGLVGMALQPLYFPNFDKDKYWTSTTWAFMTTYAFCIEFEGGISSLVLKTSEHFLRVVRGGV